MVCLKLTAILGERMFSLADKAKSSSVEASLGEQGKGLKEVGGTGKWKREKNSLELKHPMT